MQITVTAIHCEIADALQQRAEQVAARMAALAHRPIGCTVVFGVQGTASTAELRLQDGRGDVLIGSGDGPDHRTALDRAEERVRRQLESVAGRSRHSRRTEAAGG
jgi:ribosome-associated translation inhibitor RaiA